MAKPYLKNLLQIVDGLDWSELSKMALESKHFFNGAALYANGKICGLYNRGGLALKLPDNLKQALINQNEGGEFRFFPNGPIKQAYVLLSESIISDEKALPALIQAAAAFVTEGIM